MSDFTVSHRRFRFSVRTILLAIVFVALCVAQFVTMQRNRELTAVNLELTQENASLRAEAGYLEIEDPNKVAVLQMRELDELTWRWKVHLPKGNWLLRSAIRDIPSAGLPQYDASHTLSGPGKFDIAASVRKGASGDWQFVVQCDNGNSRTGLGDHGLVTGNHRSHSWSSAGRGREQTFDVDRPVELMRLRMNESVKSPSGGSISKTVTEPTDGILLWLAPRK